MRLNIGDEENRARMERGDLYYAFTPQLVADRKRCSRIVGHLNRAGELSRREIASFWKEITNDPNPLPPPSPNPTEESEDAILHAYPWIEPPIHIDYGYNIKVGSGVFINFNCTILDTCTVSIGSRTLIGPNVSLFSGTHPVDPEVRDGTNGPEMGRPIVIGQDCWIAGNVVVLPGVRIGDGCTVGAGSVVTRDIPEYHVAAGNPARVLRRIERGVQAGVGGEGGEGAMRAEGEVTGAAMGSREGT